MKTIIFYYSFSGNTKKVAECLGEGFKAKGEVEIVELKALDESETFLGQCRRAFLHKRAKLGAMEFNVGMYDVVCVGTPVWAFGPAPAVNTFLDACVGIEGKDVVLFTTYGSGTGNERCIKYMQDALVKKGAKSFKKFSVQQGDVGKIERVVGTIKAVI